MPSLDAFVEKYTYPIAHAAIGAVATLAPYIKWGTKGSLIATALISAYALLKEFVIDIFWESPELSGMWLGGVYDCLGYAAGVGLAWAWLRF